jgi:3-isopropylmalate dehydrogenase
MTISVRVITRRASSRIARAAFELARTRPRRKVTAVHKETIFKLGCGMFAEECRKVAAEFPDVELEEVMVDTFALRLVMRPQQYDVVVTTNMFGDILNDEAAGLVGGLGMTPRVNTGARHAMAQAPHGSAPDIAGRNVANPYSMIMSAQMMLDWLGRTRGDTAIQRAAALVEERGHARGRGTPVPHAGPRRHREHRRHGRGVRGRDGPRGLRARVGVSLASAGPRTGRFATTGSSPSRALR